MEVIIFVIIMIAALLVIASGIWVAIALVNAISAGSSVRRPVDRGAGSLPEENKISKIKMQN